MGVLVILTAKFTPTLFPIGIFWPALIAGAPGFLYGLSGKGRTVSFSLGVIVGSISISIIQFTSWSMLAPMLAILQIGPLFAALIAFGVGSYFSPLARQNKARNRTMSIPR